jgi:ketosteroid isomerase-like protein
LLLNAVLLLTNQKEQYMNKLKLMILVFGMGLTALAQNQKEVSQLLADYKKAMVERQWVKSLDYVYPALFDVVPREMMEEAIKTTFNDTADIQMGFESMELLEVSDIYEEDEMSYSFAEYVMVMTMTAAGEKSDEDMNTLKAAIAMQFGEENVNVEGNTLFITANNRMAVIRKTGEEKLYMLEIKPELKQIMESFMSEEFMQRAFDAQ